ncbi:hypothetical protein QBL02_11085 [Leucobacter sp. UT-8R-CII-1-4]|uniref:hypothetical protein n=1 Tax=Leucobacter sp. UT-8R-CII-1-4 TaxID=3040075 RepID=UPI0024A96248|nr:hypothetical protein [Leucobacter sp. UT-8R-CII-1-4]MDI6024089.1 hypothetical protein [Leucobacter sp. UT-8R-CII-1-4]
MSSTMKIQDQTGPVTTSTAEAPAAPDVELNQVTDLSADGVGVCGLDGYCA